MPGEKDGEFINLSWEGQPESFFIKGHIPAKDALLILDSEEVLESGEYYYKDGEWKWIDKIANLSPCMHRYGRWSMEPTNDGNGLVLRDYKDPGKGRFKITQFDILGWIKLS